MQTQSMLIIRRIVFALACVFTLSLAAQQTNTGTITGRIYKPATGEYARDAIIRVAGTSVSAISEAGGVYTLYRVPVGEVTLVLTYAGYKTVTHQVTVTPDATTTRDFDIVPEGVVGEDIVELEKFVVQGAVEGQAKSLQNQKRALTIGEHVASDAFGDVVEGNVGEFLKNLPGIDLEYVEFDARGPRMRGMDPQYVGVTLDGMKLASADAMGATVHRETISGADASRAFGFESISLAAVDAVEVYKTLSADLDADAPAGTINMRTKRAFDRKGRRIGYSAGLSAVSEDIRLGQSPGPGDKNRHKTRPNFSFDYSDVFLGGKLGIIFNYNQSSIFNESRFVQNYNIASPTADDPRSVPSQIFFGDGPKITDRTSVSFRVDYKFSNKFTAGVNFMFSDYYAFFDNRQLRLYSYGLPGAGTGRTNVIGDNPLVAFSTSGNSGYMTTTGNSASKFTKTYSIIPSFEWRPTKKLFIEGRFAWSQSDNNYKAFSDGHIAGTSNLEIYDVDFTARRSSPTSSDWKIVQTGGADWGLLDNFIRSKTGSNPTNGPLPSITDEGRSDYNKVLTGSLDATWSYPEWAMPTFFKAGIKARTDARDFSQKNQWLVWQYVGTGGTPLGFPQGLVTSNAFDLGSHNASVDSLSLLAPAFIGRTWAYQTFKAHPEYFTHISESNTPPENLVERYYNAFILNERNMEEDVTAAYVMGSTRYKKLSLQAGVRFENTKDTFDKWDQRTKEEIIAAGYGFNESKNMATSIPGVQYQYMSKPKQNVSKSYDNTFFSAALKYDITSDFIFQLGMHQAIARPSLERIAGPVSYSGNDLIVTAPNPNLRPEESDNYSTRVAYYMPSGVISAGIFQIDVVNKWKTLSFAGERPGDNVGDPPIPGDWNPSEWGIPEHYKEWTLNTPVNSDRDARYRGMELEYRQTLTFLPGFLKNTNCYVNYTRTYVHSDDPDVAQGVSPHQINFGANFKYERFMLGLSGNWLDETVWEPSPTGVSRYREASMKYHLNVSFQITRWATLMLSGRNITNEPYVVNYRYNDGRPDALARSYIYGALWTLSVKGNF